MDDFDPYSLLCDQYAVLGHEGVGYTEIRIPKKHIVQFVKGQEEFVKTALLYCKSDVYVGINPRREANGSGEAGAGMEQDISHVTAIVFDFDPVRPKGVASTDAQHSEAIDTAGAFARSTNGLLVDSGSGAHVYIPIQSIPVVDVKSVGESLRNFAKQVQEKYSTANIKVDSTFDLPRIIRCWGSWNTKSNRPCYRLSGVLVRKEFSLYEYAPRAEVQPVQGQAGSPVGDVLPDRKDCEDGRWDRILEIQPNIRKILDGVSVYPSRSESDFAFASYLFRAGCSIEEVKLFMPKNTRGKSAERREHDLDREVRRIYDKIKIDPRFQAEVVRSKAKEEKIISETDSVTPQDYAKDLANRAPGLMTGFDRWDSMTAGLKGGRFYIEAGRPTDGKTTYLVQVAANLAANGHRGVYFPTECTRMQILDKVVSMKSGVNLRKFQFGNFTSEEREKVNAAMVEVLKLPLVIHENHAMKLGDIQRAVDKHSPEYMIVDFLQSMSYDDPNNASELAANVMGIKLIGKKRNIPIILASQLHRKPDNIEDSMSDLKGTGKLEEEGDVVTFTRTVDAKPYPVLSKRTIMKNKFGEPGVIKMKFRRATCQFEESVNDPI